VTDPLTDPTALARAVTYGALDAPHLRRNPHARGKILMRAIGGTAVAGDRAGPPFPEPARVAEPLR
jgi:hypothetical protein